MHQLAHSTMVTHYHISNHPYWKPKKLKSSKARFFWYQVACAFIETFSNTTNEHQLCGHRVETAETKSHSRRLLPPPTHSPSVRLQACALRRAVSRTLASTSSCPRIFFVNESMLWHRFSTCNYNQQSPSKTNRKAFLFITSHSYKPFT